MTVPWSLIIIILSVLDWFSLPNEVKFGLPGKFEDFSPLLFGGPLLGLVGGVLGLAEALPLESARVALNTSSLKERLDMLQQKETGSRVYPMTFRYLDRGQC